MDSQPAYRFVHSRGEVMPQERELLARLDRSESGALWRLVLECDAESTSVVGVGPWPRLTQEAVDALLPLHLARCEPCRTFRRGVLD